MKPFVVQKKLERATKGTFVTTGEFETNFLGTPTEEPKLNHQVNTTLYQIVIQFEPSHRAPLPLNSWPLKAGPPSTTYRIIHILPKFKSLPNTLL